MKNLTISERKRLSLEYKRGYTNGCKAKSRAKSNIELVEHNPIIVEYLRRIAKMPDTNDVEWINIRDSAKLLLYHAGFKNGQ